MKKRALFLQKLCLAITVMKPRIQYLHEPIYKIIKQLSESGRLSYLSFLEKVTTDCERGMPFPRAWSKAVKDIPSTVLGREDAALLTSFGEAVSAADSYDIVSVISLYETAFCERAETLKSDAEHSGRMYMSLFSAAGILLGIIII